MRHLLISALLTMLAAPALADPPVIEEVRATLQGTTWRFDVTLSHPDTGTEHYADGWRILDPDGNELALRVLYHPHVNEQPFTRSLGGVVLPDGISEVGIQARCNVDGWATEVIALALSAPHYTR
ncbi:hypothetical protein N6L24_13010 [Cognatishimia sp. SS12]|uniref:hypothetical protein n=1 Tax=Cognatishimia sp. SS12 TaxID=2979465 RepID=UPI0023309C49|nr:hypothetical protein [Cognatishimia sp. SS12]MDC0739200.1 hypothetical protein [Cognatishimia sp. SS12]